MAFFIIATVLFSFLAVTLSVAMAMWAYEDAKVKSDHSPVLWLLVVLFANPIGIIIYLLVGRTKKAVPAPRKHAKFLAVAAVAFVLSAGLFTAGTMNFVGSNTGIASVSSGVFSRSWSQVRDNEWTFTAQTANGWERRSPNLDAAQLANFHVLSDSGEGVILRLEQNGIVELIDISGYFDEQINMSAFSPGRIRVTLEFDRARDVDVRVSWRG